MPKKDNLALQTQLEEFRFSMPDHSQQIDEIENSIAEFYSNVDTRINGQIQQVLPEHIEESLENYPQKKANPLLPLVLGGCGIIGILVALGLSLDFKFGESKISYKGDGVVGGLVSIVVAATGGGVLSRSYEPLKELLAKVKEQ